MTPEIQSPQPGPVGLLARAIELREKAAMPWPEAERLALSEAGVDDAEIDEVVGEAGGLEMLLTTPEDLRDFARSVLVHGSHLIQAVKARCTRSHPHEDMSAECEALTIKARAANAASQRGEAKP